MPPPNIFMPKNNFLGYCVKEGQIKKRADCGGKECMYIKD
jgi:hypothetical protein